MYTSLNHLLFVNICLLVSFIFCFYSYVYYSFSRCLCGSRLDSIIHTKGMMHTCVSQFTCMEPNSRAQKNVYSQKPIHVHKIRIRIHKMFHKCKIIHRCTPVYKKCSMFKIDEYIMDCECVNHLGFECVFLRLSWQ